MLIFPDACKRRDCNNEARQHLKFCPGCIDHLISVVEDQLNRRMNNFEASQFYEMVRR